MAKERLISTRFWNDGWVRKLNPLDRYLFLYLLTNEHTNIAGVYELPLSTMAYECGIDERDLEKTMLERMQPKAYYASGWVILTNFVKHQHLDSLTVLKGVNKALLLAPKEVIQYAKKIGYGYGMDTLWRGYKILEPKHKPKLEPKHNAEQGSEESDFDGFWKQYPTKVGKGAARSSWKKIKRPPLAIILTALEKQINSEQWKREGGRFIPNPATWLNQERWEDELQAPKKIKSYG